MPAQLSARHLRAAHGARVLFDGLDLLVAPGDVVGLVGPNGAGKSTLLRLLAGLEAPERGSVHLAPAHATVAYLPQERDRRPGETVGDLLRRRTGVAAAQQELDRSIEELAAGGAGADDRYALALERWLALGGADLDERAPAVFERIGLDVELGRAMTSLSGGQAARAALAGLLLSSYDVLLLDEPTNDLDLDGLALLESFVERQDAGIVVVSHDREFLAHTVERVVEIDAAQQQVRTHGGGFESYLNEREIERRRARERYDAYAETVSTLQERSRTQRAWADKGVRAARRDTSERDKFIRHHRIATSEQQAAKARRTDRMIERLEPVEEPRKEWQLRMSIAGAEPSGRVVSVLRDATVRLAGFHLGPVTVQVDRGDRIGITGPNGSGKSTLLSLLLGRRRPDDGEAALGASVRVGEIDQVRHTVDRGPSLLDGFRTAVPELSEAGARTLLAKFGLGGEHALRSGSTLSPGERTRAGLALLQARGVNLLVLDEPTNHLDLPAIEQLESALDAFDGTLLLVTHDRRMLSNVTLTRRWAVHDGAVVEVDPRHPGGGGQPAVP